MDNPLITIFGFVGTFYGLVLPILIIIIFTLLFIPSMQNTGAKPRGIGEAIYCYFMQIIGVILMTIGALPTIFSVLAGISFTGRTYVGLLIVFTCGGLFFLMHEQNSHNLDSASKAVPETIYFFTFKLLGTVIALLSALSIILMIITGAMESGWWVMPLVLFVYGLLLAWCTRGNDKEQLFDSVIVTAQRKRVTSKKSVKKKKR